MKKQPGLITLLLLVSFTSMLLVGTMVFYHTLSAYRAAKLYAVCVERAYALDGLINHGINQCRAADHAQVPLRHELIQTYVPWVVYGARSYNGFLTITPTQAGYTLIARITQGPVTKTETLLLSHNS